MNLCLRLASSTRGLISETQHAFYRLNSASNDGAHLGVCEEQPREQVEVSEGLEGAGVVYGGGPRIRPRSTCREGDEQDSIL